ncbi:MAG: MFS transporter [Lentisphaerae bacterium]|nr:MFS transporter [Lentisphaerota bacterium]
MIAEPKISGGVPLKTRIAWGLGGWADNYTFVIVNTLFLFLYVDYFHMDPVLAGMALAIPRVFDAITDPIIGNWSDNFRSRWGRRRPLIAVGVVGCAILLPLYWLPPMLETVSNPWYCNIPFIYISLLGCLYAAVYTLFVVPYTALGLELSDDYDERTKVLSWRMYFGLLGQTLSPLVYSLSVRESLFPNIRYGAVTMSIAAGIFILVLGMFPAIFCKENPRNSQHEKINFFRAMKGILSNGPYLILVGGFFIVLSCCSVSSGISGLINLYYVCGGNQKLNGMLFNCIGVVNSVASIASLLLLTKISGRSGKRAGFITGMIIALAGQASYYLTFTPAYPFLQLISLGIFSLTLQGCWLMLDSMTSDVCDYEELRTGQRGEGIISSFRGFIQKASGALCALLGGVLLKVCGFNAELAQSAAGLPESVLFKMKFFYVSIPIAGFILGIILFCFYPLTKKRCVEIRAELDRRNSCGWK